MSRGLIVILLVLVGLLLLSLYKIHILNAKMDWLKDNVMFLYKIIRFQGWEIHEHLKTSHKEQGTKTFSNLMDEMIDEMSDE